MLFLEVEMVIMTKINLLMVIRLFETKISFHIKG